MDSSEDGSHKEMAAINYGTTDSKPKKNGLSKPEDAKIVKICEVVVLVVTLCFAWILLLLPIIFYHLPDDVYTRKVSKMD